MGKPKLYNTEAVVIHRSKLGEADYILTLYTPHLGKLSAVAKGVRRPKSKMGGHVELLTHSQVLLARGRNLDTLTQCQTLHSFLSLREDLERVSRGLYVAELVHRFTEEHLENYPLFQLLVGTLDWLGLLRAGTLALRYFEVRLLDVLGYRPQLSTCVGCGSKLEPTLNFFSSASGGVLCPDCGPGEPKARTLSVAALKVLRLLQGADRDLASRVRMDAQLSLELKLLLRGYMGYLLEREVKSAAWLDRLDRKTESGPLQSGENVL
jgi:DNA repair protein RecO (recombination protein O)